MRITLAHPVREEIMGKKGTLCFVFFGVCDSIYGLIYGDKISVFAGIIVAIGAVWLYYSKNKG